MKKSIVFVIMLFFVVSNPIMAKENDCKIYDQNDHFIRYCDTQKDDFSDLADGKYTLKVLVSDHYGNSTVVSSNTFYIDHTKPVIYYKKNDNILTIFAIDAIDPNPTLIIKVQGKVIKQNTIDLSSYQQELMINVEAIDAAQNINQGSLQLDLKENTTTVVEENNISPATKTMWKKYVSNGNTPYYIGNYHIQNDLLLNILFGILLLFPMLLFMILTKETNKMIKQVSDSLYVKPQNK